MSIVLLFLVLLVLSFAVLLYFLKPTAMERAVERQLADIEKNPNSSATPTNILKDEATRETTILDQMFDAMPWAPALTRLVKQSGREWHPSSVFFLSLAIAVAGISGPAGVAPARGAAGVAARGPRRGAAHRARRSPPCCTSSSGRAFRRWSTGSSRGAFQSP